MSRMVKHWPVHMKCLQWLHWGISLSWQARHENIVYQERESLNCQFSWMTIDIWVAWWCYRIQGVKSVGYKSLLNNLLCGDCKDGAKTVLSGVIRKWDARTQLWKSQPCTQASLAMPVATALMKRSIHTKSHSWLRRGGMWFKFVWLNNIKNTGIKEPRHQS